MNIKQANRKIIISGGGTGGHVFPAIAIADALCLLLEKPEILFVGARGRMEMERVPEAGYRIIGLPVQGLRRKLSFANIKVGFNLLRSLLMAGKLLRDFSPHAVLGVGGYASGPVLRRAAGMGIPTLIQEQNSYAGMTNRLLAKKARKICVAYEGMEKYFPADKLVLAGNPVRKEIRDIGTGKNQAADRSDARSAFNLSESSSVILVLGGSLGARSINRALLGGLDQINASRVKVIWQCGKYYYEEMKQLLGGMQSENIRIHDFIGRMDQAYLAADIIVARAGAITISELCYVGKPVILIPSPNVAEDHQARNAEALALKSAALYIADREAADKMVPEALDLLADEQRMKELSSNISRLAIDDSAGRIAREVIEIMNE